MTGHPDRVIVANALITAAGDAVWTEAKKWPLTADPYGGRVGAFGASQQDVGRAAAAAMLRKLAEMYAPQPHPDGGDIWHLLGHADLKRIADAIEAAP